MAYQPVFTGSTFIQSGAATDLISRAPVRTGTRAEGNMAGTIRLDRISAT
jgi:hypothetical protein